MTNPPEKDSHAQEWVPRRRRARRLAMLVVFSKLVTNYSMAESRALLATMHAGWKDFPHFAAQLCELVETHLENIEADLRAALQHWKLERVGLVERAILTLGVAEIAYLPHMPPRVTINEYIELAKRYGPDNAPAFVNGVLDRIVKMKQKPDFFVRSPR